MNIQKYGPAVFLPDCRLLGPTVVRCFDGTLLMCAAATNGADSGMGNLLWRSADEGDTWTPEGYLERSFRYDRQGSMVKIGGNAALYAHQKARVLLLTGNELYWIAGRYESTKRFSRMYYRLSFDSGRTWTDKRYVITPGGTPDAPLPDVVFGRNFALSMASQTMEADDGSLLVALHCQITDRQGHLVEPEGFHFFQCGALRAVWNEDRLDYDWSMGDYVRVTPEESTRGVFEPTFAPAGPHRVWMVMRNSNFGRETAVTGQRFCALSQDDGRHWSRPRPLRYDDGGTMFACSSVPKLLDHSGGRLFYIGVINDRNPAGNGPRYPLCIAEMNRADGTVVRQSVRIIDTADFSAPMGDDFTNHGVFEDRFGRIQVYAPFRGGLNRYEISL